MANRIAGITVEIGGDTTKLSTALKSVNSEIRSTQQQLKDVNHLLKLDPGNTDLLAQKQRLLRDAIAETKEKLEALKTAAEQANEKLANGEISQQQYDALQREIVETEQKLKDLESQASKSEVALQKIAATGEKMKTLGNNIAGVGSTLTKTVTAPIVGLGTAAVKTAADFDTAMSQVAAVSGATGSDFDALRDKAREMGSKTKFSASEAAEAMNYMAMAGWKTGDMLEGIEGIMNLAAASGEDLATTSDIVTDALTAFGLQAGDSGHFADILAAASSNANTNVSMMGETFKYVAPIAGAMGYSAEDTAEAIGLMANAGIKSSQAGTTLRKIMTELNGTIEISGSALGDVTIQTTNADGSMRSLNDILADCRGAFGKLTESEKASTAESLVGKTAMSGFLALMNAAPADIQKLENAINTCSDSIDGYNGTAEKMAAVMQDNLSGQLTILKSQLQELAISIGDALMPTIREVVSHIQQWVDKFNSLDDGTKEMIVKIALFAAAVGPVLIVVGKVISAIGTIMTVIPALASGISAVTAAFGALNLTMLANPITLIIAAIVALVATFVILWNKCDAFREFWINLWNGIKDFFCGIWDGIKSVFSGVIDFIKNNWQGLLLFLVNPIAGAFKLIYDNCEGFRQFWQNLWEGVKNVFSGIVDFIKNNWQGLALFLVNPIAGAFKLIYDNCESFRNFWDNLWNNIKEAFSKIWEGIKNVCSSAWDAIKSGCSAAWDGIRNTVTSAGSAIKDHVSSAWNWIKDHSSSTWNSIKDTVGHTFENLKSTCQSTVSTIRSTVSEGWSNIKSSTTETFNHVKSAVSDAWSNIKSNVSDAMGDMKSRVTEGWENIKSTTEHLWGSIKDKVVSIAGDMKEKFTTTIGNVASAFSEKLSQMKETTTNGLHTIGESVSSALSSIKDKVTSGFSTIASNLGTAFTNLISGIKEKLSHIGQVFSDLAKNAFNWGKDIISNVISGIGSMIGSLVDKVKNVASTIKDYLGFSEPEKGPLSDFHTYMPDMIDLMKEGIEGNLSKLKGPMSDLASAIIPGKAEYISENPTVSHTGGQSTYDISSLTEAVLKYLPRMANQQVVLDSGALVGELSGGINRTLGKAYL